MQPQGPWDDAGHGGRATSLSRPDEVERTKWRKYTVIDRANGMPGDWRGPVHANVTGLTIILP